jgi:hypothetical protein
MISRSPQCGTFAADAWPSAAEAEQRLLDFVADLIIDLAKTHPAITQQHLAGWLTRAMVGSRKVSR